jgi:hypothetical protein
MSYCVVLHLYFSELYGAIRCCIGLFSALFYCATLHCTSLHCIIHNCTVLYLWGWVDGELQLGPLAVVYGEALHEEGCEPRPCSTTKRVEDEEALQCTIKSHYI